MNTIYCDQKKTDIETAGCLKRHTWAVKVAQQRKTLGKGEAFSGQECIFCPEGLALVQKAQSASSQTLDEIKTTTSPETPKCPSCQDDYSGKGICHKCRGKRGYAARNGKIGRPENRVKDDKKLKVCRACGRKGKNHGRDLCHKCWFAHKKAGTLETFPRKTNHWRAKPTDQATKIPETSKPPIAAATSQMTPEKVMSLFLISRFPEVPGLLDWLQKCMKEDFRETLENQILFVLRKAMYLSTHS
jgi:hypothetical protein